MNKTSLYHQPFNYQMIETESELNRTAEILEYVNSVAVDLEADSMFHFKEKVCLLQIATPDNSFVIDPLKLGDLTPLKPVFANPKIKKIFHGADFDVRSLHRDFGIEIDNLFDTELASRFAGIRETGLGSVLQARFGVQLDKQYQKKNWAQRPLPIGMIEYAASDVTYLLELAAILEKELLMKKRLAWVKEECDLLSKVRHIESENEPLFMRFKGAGRLDPRSLATLEALLAFRMEIAEKKDKPLFKVFSNSSLRELAVRKPRTLEALKRMNVISPKQVKIYGERFIAIIRQSFEISEKHLPRYPRKRAPKLEPVVPARIKALKSWRDLCAEKLDIDPTLLFNKANLTAIALENPCDEKDLKAIQGLKNWQRVEFGEAIINALRRLN